MSETVSPGRDRFDRYYHTPVGSTPGAEEAEQAFRTLESFRPEGGVQRISGSTSLGEVNATEFSASGSVKASKSVRVGTFKVSGSGKIEGDVLAQMLTASGSLRVGGAVTADHCDFSGSFSSEKGLCVRDSLDASGSLRAAWIQSRGPISIAGKVETGRLEGRRVTIAGGGIVRTVLGESVSINEKGSSGWFTGAFFRQFHDDYPFHADTVEARAEAYVDRAEVGLVRADVVRIGKNAKVGRVEYFTSCDIDPSARVSSPPLRVTPPR